jgi:hypothetical protein
MISKEGCCIWCLHRKNPCVYQGEILCAGGRRLCPLQKTQTEWKDWHCGGACSCSVWELDKDRKDKVE